MSTAPRSDGDLEEEVLAALASIQIGPDGPDVVSAGHVYTAVATGGVVRVLLDPERMAEDAQDALAEAVTSVASALPDVRRVVVKPRPRSIGRHSSLPGIGGVLAVHSGKGGVGKSTIAVNLAVTLTRMGVRVGLLDADVYGPSAPALLGVSGRVHTDGERIRPRTVQGLEVMSLGFLMPEGKALAWRGSLVDEGLPQLLADVDWGELDLLVVDMPPGTSDVHLALAAHVAMSGVLTVTGPGQISVQDVQRGLEMFADLATPCLGLVENMAAFRCSHCGHVQALFGTGGGERLAAATGLELLAQIPFVPEVIVSGERGLPIVLSAPGSAVASAFVDLARAVVQALDLPGEGSETCGTKVQACLH